MSRLKLSTVFIATMCSIGYLSLIIYDMSVMVAKNWNHGHLLFLQSTTIISVFSLIMATLVAAFFLKAKQKKVLLGGNFIILFVWISLLIFNVVGIIE
ncbi:hypothetical protein HH219_20935 [Pseudoalteromonas sp. NEC-BIFX-2020_015]|nr:hypothetical protein [Pseudoalteromonas sp. NEC-BIFX-2020_015]